MDKFSEDLSILMERLTTNQPNYVVEKLDTVRSRLVGLKQRNMVKINHSVMELLTAQSLISEGYEINVEHPLSGGLVCDLYATKGTGRLIIEIETGFTPPEHALDPLTYNRARIASKIARYSSHAEKFALGTPPTNVLQIDQIFLKSPRLRTATEVHALKRLCDMYYAQPPVDAAEIRNARLQAVYIIDVDNARVRQLDPERYMETVATLP